MEKLKNICRKKGLKLTPQRIAIYKLLQSDIDHPTADDIYKVIKKDFPSISFDTVNRTLISFFQIGLVNLVECSGQGRKYDPNTKKHHHLKCIKCGEITDFFYDEFDHLRVPEQISKKFKILNQKVVMTGICEKCLENCEDE